MSCCKLLGVRTAFFSNWLWMLNDVLVRLVGLGEERPTQLGEVAANSIQRTPLALRAWQTGGENPQFVERISQLGEKSIAREVYKRTHSVGRGSYSLERKWISLSFPGKGSRRALERESCV